VPRPSPFTPIADRLWERVAEHFAARETPLEGASGLNTLMTNSTFAERRTDTLLDVLFRHSDLTSVEGLRVLDAGCGLGAMALVLASRGATVVAFDPNSARMEVGAAVAREFELPVSFRRGSMEDGAAGGGTFDLVVANNSLCYVLSDAARGRALAGLRAALRPGGWIVTRNPNRLFPIDQFTGLPLVGLLEHSTGERVARRLGRQRSHVRLLAPWQARTEMRAAGFDDVVVVGARIGGIRGRLEAFARYHHVVARRPLASGLPSDHTTATGTVPASRA
jgi:2-polyprenyl-3-methyl-5-hydroxy-6-metoxy-1,4-benzoquinol methylase